MLPLDAYRDWRLCQVVGPPHTWQDMSAVRLDWILAVDDTMRELRKEQEAAQYG